MKHVPRELWTLYVMAKFDRLRVKSQQEPEPRASSYRASAYLPTNYWAINKLRVKSEAGL